MQGIDRVVLILSCLASEPMGLGISEISEKTNLPKSSLHRILTSLVEYDMAVQDEYNKKYRLGTFMLRLASEYLAQNDIIDVARPILKQISQELKESVFLSSLEGERVVCVHAINLSKDKSLILNLGDDTPINACAGAKSILAFQQKNIVRKILALDEFKQLTPHTIVSKDYYDKHLAGVRIRGYAISKEEFRSGVISIAVPVKNRHGQVNNAIGIITSVDKMDSDTILGIADVLMAASSTITKQWKIAELI